MAIETVDAGSEPRRITTYFRTTFDVADRGRPADGWLLDTARQCWRVRLSVHLETERIRGQAGGSVPAHPSLEVAAVRSPDAQ